MGDLTVLLRDGRSFRDGDDDGGHFSDCSGSAPYIGGGFVGRLSPSDSDVGNLAGLWMTALVEEFMGRLTILTVTRLGWLSAFGAGGRRTGMAGLVISV